MKTLALDLAASTGMAVGVPFETPTLERWKLLGATRGERGLDLIKRLTRTISEAGPITHITIEKPLEPERLAKLDTTGWGVIQLNGLVFLAETIAAAHDIHDRQDVLRHFTGIARYKVNEDGKRACVVRCKQLWGLTVGYDEADAGALWDYANAKLNPRGYALAGVNRPFRPFSRARP
jgi:hypothetical protein